MGRACAQIQKRMRGCYVRINRREIVWRMEQERMKKLRDKAEKESWVSFFVKSARAYWARRGVRSSSIP